MPAWLPGCSAAGDHLYVGSFGKEYTSNDGEILHANNLWVKVSSHWQRAVAR